jgi:hypothetical protein
MDIMLKILITQVAILLCGHLSMHPNSPIAEFVEKKFGDYKKALIVINGSQFILIIASLVIWLCRTS